MHSEHAGVPVVEFGRVDAETVAAVGDAIGRFGFVSLVGHGVDPALIERAYAAAAEVFALPAATLAPYERPAAARQRGYTPFRRERAVGGVAPDLKAFWHVGRDLPAGHPHLVSGKMIGNVWPEEVPAFRGAMQALFDALEAVALRVLDALAVWLDSDPDHFRALVRDGNSVLRVIDYPEVAGAEPGAVRAAAHEDINLLTVLPAATRPGLQLRTRDGRWLPIETPPDALVVDTGDMMQLLSGGRLPSVTHRVVNPEGCDGGRLSMPFFLHPRPDAELKMPGAPEPGLLAHDFLMQRLVAIDVA